MKSIFTAAVLALSLAQAHAGGLSEQTITVASGLQPQYTKTSKAGVAKTSTGEEIVITCGSDGNELRTADATYGMDDKACNEVLEAIINSEKSPVEITLKSTDCKAQGTVSSYKVQGSK